MDSYQELADFDRTANISFYAGFLGSPILDTSLKAYKSLCATDQHLSEKHLFTWLSPDETKAIGKDPYHWLSSTGGPTSSELKNADILEPHMYSWFYREIIQDGLSGGGNEGRATFYECVEGSMRLANSLVENFVADLERVTGANVGLSTELRVSKAASEWLGAWGCLDSVLDSVRNAKLESPGTRCKMVETGAFQFFPGRKLIFARVSTGDGIVMTLEQMEGLKDACYARAMSLVTASSTSADITEAVCVEVFEWQDRTLTDYGNEGYELIKAIESVGRAAATEVTDTVFTGTDGPFSRMLEKLAQKEISLGAHQPTCSRQLESIYRTHGTTAEKCIEIFGLQKSASHPTISASRGGASAAKHAMDIPKIDMETVQALGHTFSHMFLVGYIAKHGAWPRLSFTDPTSRLSRLYEAKYLNVEHGAYPLADWATCRFERCLEFDYHQETWPEILDDKSVSLPRSLKGAAWRTKGTYGGRPVPSRRLLLETLLDENFNPQELFAAFKARQLDPDELIISLYPKEREFKLEARMFAMCHRRIRFILVVLDDNLASHVFPYLSCQTMTLSRKEEIEKLHALTSPDAAASSLILEVDLSRWNLKWRDITTYPVAVVLEDLFGERGLYTNVHWFFSQCLIAVRVANETPPGADCDSRATEFTNRPTILENREIPLSQYMWGDGCAEASKRRHLGGFEGLAQKLWTACTYAMIEYAVRGFGLSYKLVGQGDNQVIVSKIPREGRTSDHQKAVIKATKTLIAEAVSLVAEAVGQEVKPEECVESTTVLSYSKIFFVKGAEIGSLVKVLSRVRPQSNEDFPGLEGEVAAAMSAALNASDNALFPLECYRIGAFVSLLALSRAKYGKCKMFSRFQLAARGKPFWRLAKHIMMFPSDLGGYAILTPLHFLYKGGADPLGKSIAWVKLVSSRPGGDAIGTMVNRGSFLSSDARAENLLADPYGLPVNVPVAPSSVVRSDTLSYLVSRVRNPYFKAVLSVAETGVESDIREVLLTLRPFNPLVARDILDASPVGVLDTARRRFIATRTVQSAVRTSHGSLIPRIIAAENLRQSWIVQTFVSLPREKTVLERPVHEITSFLRQGWTRILKVPITGVDSVSPIDLKLTEGASDVPRILVQASPGENRLVTRGKRVPYLGRDTVAHVGYQPQKIQGDSSAAKSVRRMLKISATLADDHDTIQALSSILRTRCAYTFEDLRLFAPRLSGGIADHRFVSMASSRSASTTGTSAAASWLKFDTDRSDPLSGGEEDYPFMFQEMMVFLAGVCRRRLRESRDGFYISMIIDPTILKPLENSALQLSGAVREVSPEFSEIPGLFMQTIEMVDASAKQKRLSAGQVVGVPPGDRESRSLLLASLLRWLRSDGLVAKITDGIAELAEPPFDVATASVVSPRDLMEICAIALALERLVVNVRAAASRRWNRLTDDLDARRLARVLGRVANVSLLQGQSAHSVESVLIRRSNRLRYEPSTATGNMIFERASAYTQDPWSIVEFIDFVSYSDMTEQEAQRLENMVACATVASAGITGKKESRTIAQVFGEITSNASNAMEARAAYLAATATLTASTDPDRMSISLFGAARSHYDEHIAASLRKLRSAVPWRARRVMRVATTAARVVEDIPLLQHTGDHLEPRRFHVSTDKPSLTSSVVVHLERDIRSRVWERVIGNCAGYNVVVIGSGLGECARLALAAGASMCFGVDLESDLTGMSIDPISYVPLRLDGTDLVDRYVQIRSCWTSPSGISDPQVRSDIRYSLDTAERAMVIVDHLSGNESPMAELTDLSKNVWFREACIRLVGSELDLASWANSLARSSATCQVARAGTRCLIVRITGPFRPFYECGQIVFLPGPEMPPVGDPEEALIGCAFGMAPGARNGEEVLPRLRNVLRKSLGKYLERGNFSEHTEVLMRVAAAEFIIASGEGQIAILEAEKRESAVLVDGRLFLSTERGNRKRLAQLVYGGVKNECIIWLFGQTRT